MAIECSTKVEQSPQYCKVEGLSPAAIIGTIIKREKEEKKDRCKLMCLSLLAAIA